MAELSISESEKIYVFHGIQDGYRCDGRGFEDYRPMELETGLLANANGSARIRLASTDVLVGIKAELSEPLAGFPDDGYIEFAVDCSPNASPDFEGRGGEALALEIQTVLARAYKNNAAIDYSALSVLSNKHCWLLNVDILVLECGGNLFDTISVAVKAALFNLRLPRLQTQTSDSGNIEIELLDDPLDCQKPHIADAPILITLNQIGNSFMVDASLEEEACTRARLLVGVAPNGDIMLTQKTGAGSLQAESIADMLTCAHRVGKIINDKLLAALTEEEKIDRINKLSGFLR